MSVYNLFCKGTSNMPVSGSTPKRSAICAILSGLKVPSVSAAICQKSEKPPNYLELHTNVGYFALCAT
jgi:hypothetical protein